MMHSRQSPPKPDFGQLVEQHAAEIHAYLYRMLGQAEDAEDCLQDAFLRAYRAYARLEPGANFRAWLYRIAGNVARSKLQTRARQNRHASALEDRVAPSTEDQVEWRLRLEATRRAVERLPDKQRQALIMRKYQQLEYAEIAEALGCSQSAARANVYQGLRRLREDLTPARIRKERSG